MSTIQTPGGNAPVVCEPTTRLSRIVPWAVAMACGAMGILLFWLGRGLTFFYDEWAFLFDRRALTLDSLLEPHNGHLSILPVLAYQLLMWTVGASTYWPYFALVVSCHLLCAGLLYQCARDRVGVILAGVFAFWLLTLGRAWQNLLWAFQIGFLASLAAGLAALWFLDRGTRPADRRATWCVAASLACSGLGVPVLAAISIELVWRRGICPALRVVAVPAMAYGTWYITYGSSEAKLSNADLLPRYVGRSAEGAVGAMLGLDSGRLAVIGTVVLVAVVLAALTLGWWTPRFAGALIGALVFWSLTGLSRGALGEPTASRYLYPGFLFLVLAVIEIWPRLKGPAILRAGVLTAVVAAAALSNIQALRRGGAELRETSLYVRAQLAAVELLGTDGPPDLQPDPVRMPQVTAEPYLHAVRDLGSPAFGPRTVTGFGPRVRGAVDDVLARGLSRAVAARQAPGSGNECREMVPSAGLAELDVSLDEPFGLRARETLALVGRRFGDAYATHPLMRLAPGESRMLRRTGAPAVLGIELAVLSDGPFTLCVR